MHITLGRRARLMALGTGFLTAASVALSASGPALADTADTGGTGSLSVPVAVLAGAANANIVVLAVTPGSSSFDPATRTDNFTMPVTGGNGEVGNFYGTVDYGGSLAFFNAKTGKNLVIASLELNFFTGKLTGVLPGGAHQTAIAYLNGTMSSSTSAGPPATETFSCDELDLSTKGAAALNSGLGVKVFKHGLDIGAFTTTFDVTIT